MTYEVEECDFPIAGKITGDGFTVEIRYDEYPEQPRWGDANIGTMLTSHPNYQFGGDDDITADGPLDTTIDCPRCAGSGEDPDRYALWRVKPCGHERVGSGTEDSMQSEADILGSDYYVEPAPCPKCEGDGWVEVGVYEWFQKKHGATVVLPLFLLDHSGLRMRAGSNMGSVRSTDRFIGDSAGWDTSFIGFIFDTPEAIERTGCPLDKVEEGLRSEINEYDSYLMGDVYFVTDDIPEAPSKEQGAIGGFIGFKYACEQAQEMAEWAEQAVAEERAERARCAASDIITK